MNDAGKLFETLRKIQEPKGFFFNNVDKAKVLELLEGLLVNKKRYGYMACPCRLASGKQELDRDIVCPCAYRTADVAEFGTCYCSLYVSREWNQGKVPRTYVPERRPPEKLAF